MTDRRIERSVSAHIAGLEARTRTLETLMGAGRQRGIEDDAISGIHQIPPAQTSYGDLDDSGTPVVGPVVTVRVNAVGIVQCLVSATPWPTASGDTFPNRLSQARVSLEFSGANVISAGDFATDEGYLSLHTEVAGDAAQSVAIIGSIHRSYIIRGLSSGETTITMKYLTNYGDVINVNNRHLLVVPF